MLEDSGGEGAGLGYLSEEKSEQKNGQGGLNGRKRLTRGNENRSFEDGELENDRGRIREEGNVRGILESEKIWGMNFFNEIATMGSLRALVVVFVVTTLFTMAQFFGAFFANSLSMLGDCITMAVDSATYAMNIFAEKAKIRLLKMPGGGMLWEVKKGEMQRLDKRVALVSALSLVGVTLYILIDAAQRLQSEAGVDPVKPKIMFWFTAINLVMNFISCTAFLYIPRKKKHLQQREASDEYEQLNLTLDYEIELQDMSEVPIIGDAESSGRVAPLETAEQEAKTWFEENLNLLSAFAHLLADTLRSLTVFVTSTYVWSVGGDAVFADAVSSLIVCSMVLMVAGMLLWETLREGRDL